MTASFIDSRWYLLEGTTTRPVTIEEYCQADPEQGHSLLLTTATGNGRVVTAFFGFDHRLMAQGTCPMDDVEYDEDMPEVPILFGTMIFGGSLEGTERMWSTHERAIEGHRRMVEEARIAG